jgi:Ca2+-binding RTX toxin-like protein
VTIAGKLFSFSDAINFEDADGTHRITIQAGAEVNSAEGAAVTLGGQNGTVINRGLIIADDGIQFSDDGAGTSRVTNYGRIIGDDGIEAAFAQRIVVKNFGQILMPGSDALDGSTLNDVFINKGNINGGIEFDDGNDRYEGFGGSLRGEIYGGNGNDIFRAGAGFEVFYGGDDIDLVDYRQSGAVKIWLDNSAVNQGAARGDLIDEVERAFGSLLGSDRITAGNDDNDLRGFGGNDTLIGGDGEDLLMGGNGVDRLVAGQGGDTLIGGKGIDTIILGPPALEQNLVRFNNINEFGDKIDGFIIFDELEFTGSAIGGGLELGALLATRFKSGLNNKAADADDRFIFRTGDATLWFDRDGNGTAFKSVLVADFSDETTILDVNITIL